MSDSEVLTLIEHVRSHLARIRPLLGTVPSTGEIPEPLHILTNTDLLLRTLDTFYRQEQKRTPYLPRTVTGTIVSTLRDLDSAFLSISVPSADEPAPQDQGAALYPLLARLDDLYAHCLMYGIISFGLDANVAKERVARLEKSIVEIESAKAACETGIRASLEDFQAKINDLSEGAAERLTAYQTSLQEKLNAAEPQMTSLADNVAAAEASAKNANERLSEVDKLANEVTTMHGDVSGLLSSTSEKRDELIQKLEESLGSSESLHKQISDEAAQAKADAKIITDTKAAATAEQSEISGFYRELETRKKEMQELTRKATADVTEYSNRTNDIIKKNESLIDEINEHLTKAVGVSLFKAFGSRRFWLAVRTWSWAIVLFGSTILAVWFAYSFALSLTVPDVRPSIVFAKLLIAVPIAFVISFAARQYSRERRAEEEYAFKETMSVSLEPYRLLVERMRDAQRDTAFVEKLIENIFDNPTKRLYPPAFNYVEDGDNESDAQLRTPRQLGAPPSADGKRRP